MLRFIKKLFNRAEDLSDPRNPKYDGEVLEIITNGFFRVRLDNMDHTEVISKVNGPIRRKQITILPGDTVKVELNPYDSEYGMITKLIKKGGN